MTLNSDLVAQAKALTGNLSGKVEALLAEFVASEHELQGARRRELARAAEEWGAFVETHGSLADEFSTLWSASLMCMPTWARTTTFRSWWSSGPAFSKRRRAGWWCRWLQSRQPG
ncbi:type II toxin-antitoxin system CcdA family antitoxin [Stenotrophomonas sp. NPDC078853]|uniref:type II toxin-antitoxin system CcdA family antitoxin n=1 Tax=Stenotrophomonas sp. NPDC078853 TaxID=3364534 RepID=UPI00384A63E1